jgi:hypothetical protein
MAFTLSSNTPTGRPPTHPRSDQQFPNWEIGDRIPFGPDKPALLVVGIRNASETNTHGATRRND